VGADQFVEDVSVQNGLFTTAIDFGPVWDGSDRYLEIAVRPGASTGGYQELAPRVRVTPTPYAILASRLKLPFSGSANVGSGAVFSVTNTAPSGVTYSGYFSSASTSGRGVAGEATATSGATDGVFGVSYNPSGYGVYLNGRFAATGTKAFQIDHPLQPDTHYLNHFCAEGPEPYNIYRGTVVLDARGEAWVQLPDYFEAINRDPSYHLTPVGAPMPNLHVAIKIQNNRFKIAGGAPGKEVSWRIEAVRNDLWVQRYGYQTEQEKEDAGKYIHPELYGQPKEKGIHHRPEPEPTRNESSQP